MVVNLVRTRLLGSRDCSHSQRSSRPHSGSLFRARLPSRGDALSLAVSDIHRRQPSHAVHLIASSKVGCVHCPVGAIGPCRPPCTAPSPASPSCTPAIAGTQSWPGCSCPSPTHPCVRRRWHLQWTDEYERSIHAIRSTICLCQSSKTNPERANGYTSTCLGTYHPAGAGTAAATLEKQFCSDDAQSTITKR